MHCALCDRENREGAKYCDGCGAALDVTLLRSEDDPLLSAIRVAFNDRYQVESLLGRGGMGHVYKARERSLDRHVALKVIPQERNSDTVFVERFRREAKIAARLRHPRIVSVHEVGTHGGFHYFSMDFIEGSTLRAVVQRRRTLPADDAVAVLAEILRAVAHAHSRGVIHRDLKPENVMIDHEGDVFVLDFGLARAVEDHGLTTSGVIVGSPTYMSPEQLTDQPLDARSDLYSLGLIFFYCLTGEDVFGAETFAAVVARHMEIDMASELRAYPSIPPHLYDLLLSMLEEDRDRRAGSAKAILDRLTLPKGRALAQHELPTVETDRRELATPPPAPESDPELSVAAQKRKNRLKSLLDEM